MPDRDLTFFGVFFPFGDGIANPLVQGEQSILDGEHRKNARKALRAASEHVGRFLAPIVVAFKDPFSSVLDQDSVPAVPFGVIGRGSEKVLTLALDFRIAWSRRLGQEWPC